MSKNCEKGARQNVGSDQTVFVILLQGACYMYFFSYIFSKKLKIIVIIIIINK